MSKIFKIVLIIIIIEIIIGIGYVFITRPKEAVALSTDTVEVCGTGGGCSISAKRVQGYEVGMQLPNLELTTIDGETTMLYDLLEGKDKFILSLAADWCSDCQRQDDKLNEYYNDLPENYGAAVLFVDYSSNDGSKTTSKEQVTTYLEDQQYTFPTFWDEDNKIANEFGGVLATPTNIVLDSDAVIKAKTEEIDMDILFATNEEKYNDDFLTQK